MKISKFGLFLIPCVLAFGQEPAAPAEKPPAEVDQALRGRVAEFYQAFIEGKFRKAYLLVSDDSQDAFMESGKDQYKSCETIKIDYADNFTKATVLESCNGVWRWHGADLATKVPLSTHWKLQNGEWYWCYVRATEIMTPFGKAILRPEVDTARAQGTKPAIPDQKEFVKMVLNAVKADKDTVLLRSWEQSKDEVHVRNEAPGDVELRLYAPGQPGLKVHADKTTLAPQEEATILFEYKVDDAEVLCGECARKVHGTITVMLNIVPTGQVIPISVTFLIPANRKND